MGAITGANAIALFIRPQVLDPMLGRLFGGIKAVADKLRVGPYLVIGGLEPEMSERLWVKFAIEDHHWLFGDLYIEAYVHVEVVAGSAESDLCIGLAATKEVRVKPPDRWNGKFIAGLAAAMIQKEIKKDGLGWTGRVRRAALETIVGYPPRQNAWFVGHGTHPGDHGGVVELAAGYEPGAGICAESHPLAPDRELGLALNGARLAEVLTRIASRSRTDSLPFGLTLASVRFTPDIDAFAVSAVLTTDLGAERIGPTRLTLDGRIGLVYDRERADAKVVVSGLKPRFETGIADGALAVVRVLTPYLSALVERALRDLAKGLLEPAIDRELDKAERDLRGLLAALGRALGARATLHDAAIVDGDLWLAGDLEPPSDRPADAGQRP